MDYKKMTKEDAMKRVLEMVLDSPAEPDKWFQDVRFVLERVDGKERPGKTAFQRRDERRVQIAAPRLLDVCKKVLGVGAILADDTPEKPSIVYGHPDNRTWASIFLAARAATYEAEGRMSEKRS